MNENNRTGTGEKWRGLPEEETIRRLVGEAGPRNALPEDDLAQIKDAARRQWRQRYGAREPLRRPVRWWMSLAAALLSMAVLVWWARTREPRAVDAATVATLERVTGFVKGEAEGVEDVELAEDAAGRTVFAGWEFETGSAPDKSGSLALRMAGGASVRLDAGTEVRLVSAAMIELHRGGVYVDTGAGPRRGDEISIRTPAGLFQGLGTQFEVRAEAGGVATRLRVREGRVRVERRKESVLAGAGEEVVARGDGSLVRRPIPTYGPEWDWVVKAAPMLAIEGVTVRTFLDWVSRETGWRVEFTDVETAALCDSTVLHGSIGFLTPAEAPGVVLPSAALGHRMSDGTLLVYAEK